MRILDNPINIIILCPMKKLNDSHTIWKKDAFYDLLLTL
jgi:hypothetical protein